MSETVIALIPAYKPTSLLVGLVKELSASGLRILIVDDGSGPAFAQIFDATRAYATVLSYEPNQGKGHALKEGYRHIQATAPDDSIIVTLDADGQHTVADAWKVARLATIHPSALTLGVRTFGKNTPVRSRFGNTVTRMLYGRYTGQYVSDTQTGLRAFGMRLLPFLASVEGERYEHEMNVLLECPKQNIRIQEQPIETIYLNGNKGSHFQTIRDSILVYSNIFKFALSSFTGFVLDYGIYSLLVILSGSSALSVPVANVVARVVSASANFSINRHFVFKNNDSVLKTGVEYFIVAACILGLNTLLLSLLVHTLDLNKFIAKLITEITFFIFSWLAQRFWIFRKKRLETWEQSAAETTEQPTADEKE